MNWQGATRRAAEEAKEKGLIFPRIVVTVPPMKTGTVDDESFIAFWRLARQGWELIDIPYQRCDKAHNEAAKALLHHNERQRQAGHPERTYTHLVTLDIDHIHPVNLIMWLGGVVKNDPDKLVVGGLNFRRSKPFDPCAFIEDDDEPGRVRSLGPVVGDGLTEVDYLGAGSLIIAEEVFWRTEFPWFGYDYVHCNVGWPECGVDGLEGAKWPGVDMWFSKRCKDAGIPLWLDTRVTSPHLGKDWIGKEHWDAYRQTDEFVWGKMSYTSRLEQLQTHLPELWEGAKDILYVGANRNRAHYAKELADVGNTVDLLEIDPGNCDHWRHKPDKPFRFCHDGDVRTWQGKLHDVVFWWHGPEHIQAEELDNALSNIESLTRPGGLIVLGCPWGQGFDGNPISIADRHKSEWDIEDFTSRGYDVQVNGVKDSDHNSLIAWKRKR